MLQAVFITLTLADAVRRLPHPRAGLERGGDPRDRPVRARAARDSRARISSRLRHSLPARCSSRRPPPAARLLRCGGRSPWSRLWSNAHVECVFGVVLLFAFAASEWVWPRRLPRAEAGRALKIAMAAAAATLLNPYGWGLWQYLYENLSVQGVVAIAELLPPSLPGYRAFYAYARADRRAADRGSTRLRVVGRRRLRSCSPRSACCTCAKRRWCSA